MTERIGRQEWGEIYASLLEADASGGLDAADLERLANAAYLCGDDDAAFAAWSRSHRRYVAVGDLDAAARCALWLGIFHLLIGQLGHAHGWFARARGAAGDGAPGSLAAAYADAAAGLEALFTGDPAAAVAPLDAGARLAARHGDADFTALGRLGCGQALVMAGRVAEGVTMLDDAMLTVTAGEVSPVAVGLIYCAVIETCHAVFELRRAQEWTAALTDWCAAQTDLVPFRGQCLVHRAELARLHGKWSTAQAESAEAARRLREPPHPALGAALYEQAELYRLRGDGRAAEHTYRLASDVGHGAQPGLALLRLAQARVATAAAALGSALAEARVPADRARLLAASVEVALAGGDTEAARVAADDLARLAGEFGDPPLLAAMVGDADGAVLVAAGDAHTALAALRRAWTAWHDMDAPYEAARTRLLIGLACRALDDEETATMELDAARNVFARLGAAPDVARVDILVGRRSTVGGLTTRELQVLALIAGGATNRAIAAQLVISEKTVARHVHNILTKLGVASRAAATAYAYQHELV